MRGAKALERGRAAFRRQEWGSAFEHLSAAHEASVLERSDLELLATAAHLLGRYETGADLWAHAHQELLSDGDPAGAARCAFWLGFTLVNRGERARAGGWFARAGRILDESGVDCVEGGYLLIPQAIRATMEGDLEGGYRAFSGAVEVGEQFSDPDLICLARHGQGRAFIRKGEVERGVALLDEAMAVVTSGGISCLVAGVIYCSVLEACRESFDPGRAREWTEAMTGWLDGQPDLVPFRGQCLVHRSEVMQWAGHWDSAMEEARRARDHLVRPPPQPAAGGAYYQQAELHRLRGELAAAEEAYREANRWGRGPQPGLSLLRLAQGRKEDAQAGIRRALHEARAPWRRAELLPAAVEIFLAAGQVAEARSTLEALGEMADELKAPPLLAAFLSGEGAVGLAMDDAASAVGPLREGWGRWRDLGAPYEAARTRVLLARACRALGDGEGAALELDAARWTFRRLGAVLDLRRLEAELGTTVSSSGAHGLTPRQLEVLRHLATGETNRAIAAALFISERTVERHVSDIFSRLGVSTRAAAAAYAHKHGLV